MIASENANALALDNVAGIRERSQSGGGRRTEGGGKSETFGRADGGDPSGAKDPRRTAEGGGCSFCQATLKGTPLRAVPIPTPCMRSYYRFSPPLWLSVFRRLSGPASRSGRSRSVFGNLERINPLLRFSRNRKLSPVIKRVWL
jgi:hypothetical protein